jgi:aspartyl protease family protein
VERLDGDLGATMQRWLGVMGLVLVGNAVQAVDRVQVLALFPDKAVLSIDGAQRLLTAGQTSPEGVKLIAADSKGAVLEINGQRQTQPLSSQIETHFQDPPPAAVAHIWRDRDGAFTTSGSINGDPVQLLVDTGASVVVLSAKEAERLKIPFRKTGKPATALTAAGTARAYGVMLDRLRVGEIELRNVEGAVIEGSDLPMVLLGQTFLNRVSIEHKGNLLQLQQSR